MSDNVVRYGVPEAITARAPSPVIWADCPVGEIANNPSLGIHLFDDFKNSIIHQEEAARSALTDGIGHISGDINWQAFTETALIADIALQADDNGVLMIDTDGQDDDTAGITTGDNVVGIIRSPLEGEQMRFWFETRIKVNTVTDGDLPWFIGLMAPGSLSNGSPLGAGGALADVDYIGFHTDEADGNAVDLVYNEASLGTAQAVTGLIATEADTYVRLGMKLVVSGNSIEYRFFKDGVDVGNSGVIDLNDGANANWPGDTNMDVIITVTSGTSGEDADNMKIDWVRVAQLY